MTNNDTNPSPYRYIVMDDRSGKQAPNPYAASPLDPTDYDTAHRYWQQIRHHHGTAYYIEEVPAPQPPATAAPVITAFDYTALTTDYGRTAAGLPLVAPGLRLGSHMDPTPANTDECPPLYVPTLAECQAALAEAKATLLPLVAPGRWDFENMTCGHSSHRPAGVAE